MSIHINEIYCNHYLKTPELKDFCLNSNFDFFIYPKDELLTSFHVKDTIHYKALINNDFKNYEKYVSITCEKDHGSNTYKNLRDTFNIDTLLKNKIKIEYNYDKNKYFIIDGVHRLSIMVYKGIITDEVPIHYLDIINNNNFYFVIYDHGIDKQNDIFNIIKKNDIRIDKKIKIELPSNKFKEFILDIYPDTNKNHILAKNKFIIDNCKNKNIVKAIIIITSLNKWNLMGNKCKEIELTKREIRNNYNPKFKDINRRIKPLNKGVSHNHVIHSIDFPKEFIMIYNIIEKYNKYFKNF